MAYADGELDEARRAEVEAFVAATPAARAKLAAMGVVGDVVRDEADRPSIDLADAIFARIDAEPAPAPKKLPRVVVGPPSPPSRRSANDNAFRIFSLAAAAVAVAAGVMIWARTDPSAPVAGLGGATGAASAALTAAPPPHTAAPYEAESEVGASVAAVDFGSNTGSIFYVPTGVAMTTVVWVAETGPGEP
jgi:anti-sigma factor RsiW